MCSLHCCQSETQRAQVVSMAGETLRWKRKTWPRRKRNCPAKLCLSRFCLYHPGHNSRHLTTDLHRLHILARLELASCLGPSAALCKSTSAQRPVKQCEQSQQWASPPGPSSAAAQSHRPKQGRGRKFWFVQSVPPEAKLWSLVRPHHYCVCIWHLSNYNWHENKKPILEKKKKPLSANGLQFTEAKYFSES